MDCFIGMGDLVGVLVVVLLGEGNVLMIVVVVVVSYFNFCGEKVKIKS